MGIRWIDPICHSIWTDCNRRRIYVSDILEWKVQLLSQHIQEVQNLDYQDEAFEIESDEKQLSIKEAAQLVWHSFRFSNGYPPLQFTMMYQAFQKYWKQGMSVEECGEVFFWKLKVWKTHTETTEYENKDWRPPHPKIYRFTTEVKTDIGLSIGQSHRDVTNDLIQEWLEPVKMLLTWKWHLTRSAGRDWEVTVSRSKDFEYKWQVIEDIFKRDFKYLLTTKDINGRLNQPFGFTWDKIYPWRPNRDDKNDGSNNLKDRYFSYFIWYIIKSNRTWNEFFDEYFWELHSFFAEWFKWLPTDSELEETNRQWRENERFYSSLRPHRESFNNSYSSRSFRKITKEDILMLIARYNATHPDTQVEMNELWLSELPHFNSMFIKNDLKEEDRGFTP